MEELDRHTEPDRQQELLRQYCSEAEELIKSARTTHHAMALANAVCSRLKQECGSELIVNATRSYVEAAIQRQFGSTP